MLKILQIHEVGTFQEQSEVDVFEISWAFLQFTQRIILTVTDDSCLLYELTVGVSSISQSPSFVSGGVAEPMGVT